MQDLTRTGDVEASLRRYPQYTDRLRPLLETAQVIRHHYDAVPEAPGGLAAGRERMLAVAAQQRARNVGVLATPAITTTRGKGRRKRFVFAMRFITVLLAIIVGTSALGGGTLWAAGNSLPGDLLYPIKLATEDIRLALTSAPADQVGLALQFVEERVEEIQALVTAGRRVPDETIVRLERHIESALIQAAWVSDEEIVDLLTCIASRTHVQAQTLEQAQATAPQRDQAGLERAVTVCRQGKAAAESGLNDPQAFRRRYRHQQETLEPTSESEQATVTPEGNQVQEQEQELYQRQNQERNLTPIGMPSTTPHEPHATPVPQTTSPSSHATPSPRITPHGPQATPDPQATTQGPQRTCVPTASAPGSQQPGGGNGGQDGKEHGSGH